MSMNITALPSDLLDPPKPLIGFVGLDILRNPIHQTIWDAFNNNSRKMERGAVQYKQLDQNYNFPVAKPKRPSYEWYHPKGILKRNWMLKHLHVLPAVLVLFQDIEWNDPQWTEKQLQCASIVQGLKNRLQERNTRIALVLLQKASPLPPGEDALAGERAASLTNACSISNKMLFILPHSDHLMGYTLRLESAFLEMAQTYYAQMSKRIRTHRDQLTASHVTLKIRHQFKLGFVAEMRSDYSTALKHYTQAYGNVDEIRITDQNCLEIKTVAGFLNFKICRLMFKLNVPRDSINHFLSHVEKYKNQIGVKELLFEHYSWLSTQHSSFAGLFCEAIKNGLPALQIQHPGIYFHKAAEYTIKRREAFLQCCSLSSNDPPNSNPNTLFSEFFGVRTAKAGEPVSEQQIITLVQENEKNFDHSDAIIKLLELAKDQFKIYKCQRFRKKLMIEIAEEYYRNGDHQRALTLFSVMLPDYRQDKWNSIFSDVLFKTLRCAFLSASVADFITCSIETLAPSIEYDQSERVVVLENLWKVFQGVPPISPSQIAPELRTSWEKALANFNNSVRIDLDQITRIFECGVSFENLQIHNDEKINIKVYFRNLTSVPFKIRNINAHLTDSKNTFKLKAIQFAIFSNFVELRSQDDLNASNVAHYNTFEGELKLEPDVYYTFLFCAESRQLPENIQLVVSQIDMQMGTDKFYANLVKNANFSKRKFKHYNRSRDLSDNVTLNPFCYIVPTFHLVTSTNLPKQPMLVNEYFNVLTSISNPYNVLLQNVGVTISVPANLRNKVFLTADISPNRQKLLSQIQIDIGDIFAHGTSTISYYVFSFIEAQIELKQSIWYQFESTRQKHIETVTSTDNSPITSRPSFAVSQPPASHINIDFLDEKNVKKMKEEVVNITCVGELKFDGRFYTLNRQPLTSVYRGENFLLRTNIEVQAPVALEILETYFICDHNLVQSNYSFKRKKYTNVYTNSEKLEDVIVLRTNSALSDWITQKKFESNQLQPQSIFNRNRRLNPTSKPDSGSLLNKSLLSKIPNNMTIIGNTSLIASQNSNLSSSTISDDGKLKDNDFKDDPSSKSTPIIVFNKASDAIQQTGHHRGFLKGILTEESSKSTLPVFGLYCIKWKRQGYKEENESRFVVSGLDIEEPPLNIYCSVEEKMFVKVPMTLKVVLKNPTSKVIHLISTLSVSTSDNFMCSGHKQLNISILANSESELVFNLYPLKVGWQILPTLTLEYNTQADPNKDDVQNSILCQLVQRAMPKKVFVLPPNKLGRSHK